MKKKKLIGITAAVSVLAIIVTGLVIIVLYNTVLKPKDFGNIIPASGQGTGYFRYCYNELNDNEKEIYAVALAGLYSGEEEIEVPALTDGDLNKILKALSSDNPDLFNLGLKGTIYKRGLKTFFKPEYALDYATYTQRLKEADDIASVIVDGASAFTSPYDKEKYVHDYIITQCSYVEPEAGASYNTIYGCLVEGKASCEGYSRAFQFILNKLDIDNRLVTGESADDGVNFIRHMWNFVTLEEGESYFVDLTWDDPKAQNAVLRHTYFNVPTSDILINHKNIEQPVPLTTATQYNYFVREGLMFQVGSGDVFESAVYNAVFTAVEKQYKCAEFRFISGPVKTQGINALFNEGVLNGALISAGLIPAGQTAQVYYSSDDNLNVVCVYF